MSCDHKFVDSSECLRCGARASSLLALLVDAKRAALLSARTALCDLLIGRQLRARAAEELGFSLWLESRQAYRSAVDQQLALAAHWEWIAVIAERGQMFWGNRQNRCGACENVTPEELVKVGREPLPDAVEDTEALYDEC